MIYLRSALLPPNRGTEAGTAIAVLRQVNNGLREDFNISDLSYNIDYSDYT